MRPAARPASPRPATDPRPTSSKTGRRGTRLRYRPALDGLRGLAVASCLTYQMIPGHFTGGWLGVDMFLVLSGFFIASMLLQEHRSTGSIDYWNFIKRRGRRLLPGQLSMFAGVLLLTYLLAPPGRWASTAGDVVGSIFQVANWRFIAEEQSYFNNLGMPSPLRHMWSLSVQEQYYLLFPLVLIAVGKVLTTRATKMAFFAALAGLSLARMISLYEPGTDPSRVYFGTDTRIFEVLIGVLAAFLLSERAFAASRGRRHRGWLTEYDSALGWAGLGAITLLFFWMITLTEYSPWLFQGGLAIVCGLTLVAIVAASSPTTNLAQRILSWAPLRWVGRMGLPLYLWHWPLWVFTGLAIPSAPVLIQNVVSMSLTVGLAVLTHKHLEMPVHERGVAALLPSQPQLRRVLVLGAVPALLTGSLALRAAADSAGSGERGGPDDVALTIPEYQPQGERLPVVLLGNSVAAGLGERGELSRFSDLQVEVVASLGCDPYLRDVVTAARGVLPPTAACTDWRASWPERLPKGTQPLVVYLMSPALLNDFLVDGQRVEPGGPGYEELVRGVLDEMRQRAHDGGAGGFALSNLACHERPDFGNDEAVRRSNDEGTVKELNAIAARWAQEHRVHVFDVYATLCEGDRVRTTVAGEPLYDDTIHYSVRSAPLVFAWMAPTVQQLALRRGTETDGLADLR